MRTLLDYIFLVALVVVFVLIYTSSTGTLLKVVFLIPVTWTIIYLAVSIWRGET